MTALKAYAVHDGGERTVIVFGKANAAARREGANEMDIDFSEVDYCHRAKWADRYAEDGHVPAQAKFEWGWWQECCGCEVRIELDAHGDNRAFQLWRAARCPPHMMDAPA
jgi:hypothetical protein